MLNATSIANQAVETEFCQPEYSYITLASPSRLYSTPEIYLFAPLGFKPALESTEPEMLTNALRPQNLKGRQQSAVHKPITDSKP